MLAGHLFEPGAMPRTVGCDALSSFAGLRDVALIDVPPEEP